MIRGGERELKLECIRLANMLGTSKTIKPTEVVQYAMEFYRWVDGAESVDSGKLEELRERFQR